MTGHRKATATETATDSAQWRIFQAYPQFPRAVTAWRWWRSVLAIVMVVVLFAMLGFVAVKSLAWLVSLPALGERFDSSWRRSPVFDMLLAHVALMLLIPPCLLAAKWGFRYDGLLWSVAGRLRWSWFWRCAAVALAGMLILLLLNAALGSMSMRWQPEPKAWALVLMALLLTPWQALAEELLFRGVLLQAVGSWFARPLMAVWVATLVSSVLFALVHGQQSPAVFLDRLFMGVLLCWLAYKTQGLEASIALHIVNNQVTFLLATVTGTLESALTAAQVSQLEVVLHVTCVLAVALVLRWWYGCSGCSQSM